MRDEAQSVHEILARVILELEELKKENTLLRQKIADLKSQINSNIKNSSRPPSSDGYRKKPSPALLKTTKGKKGGQKGHKGALYAKPLIQIRL